LSYKEICLFVFQKTVKLRLKHKENNMKRILLSLIAGLLFTATQGQNAQVQLMLNQVSGDTIWSYIATLSDMERYAPADDPEAPDFLKAYFEQLGYDTVYFQKFNNSWMPNVVAEKTGTLYPDSIYILGGHFDTWALNAPGADDNASGTAGVMETARLIADADFDKTIRLLCFSGEEEGLFGSKAYAQYCVDQNEIIAAMINLDMISHSETGTEDPVIWVSSNSFSNWMFEDMKQFLLDYSIDAGWADGFSSPYAYSSDHASFWAKGIPAIFLIDCLDVNSPDFNHFIHSDSDIIGTSSNNKPLAEAIIKSTISILGEYASVSGSTNISEQLYAENDILVYPNPAQDFVNVLVSETPLSIAVFNVNGQELINLTSASTGNNQINCSQLNSGVYFVKVLYPNGYVAQSKFVK
jgi:aminopeptidase YwaD